MGVAIYFAPLFLNSIMTKYFASYICIRLLEIHVRSVFRALILCFPLLISFNDLNGQSGRPSFDGSRPMDADQFLSVSDTIERPDFRLKYYDIERLEESVDIQDTSLLMAANSVPYYWSKIPSINLGSENSATLSASNLYDDRIVPFGHNSYNEIFSKTSQLGFYEVNRPYWTMHYGIGIRIGSSNFSTKFYKNFARGIGLNFRYDTHGDDGWPDPLSSNRFKRINISFFKRNKSKSISYILLDSPQMTESIRHASFDPSNNNLIIQNKKFKIEAGRKVVRQDSIQSSFQSYTSRIKYFTGSYSSVDNGIKPSSSLLILNSASNNNYKHSIKNFEWYNQWDYKFGNWHIQFPVILGRVSNAYADIANTNTTYGVVGAKSSLLVSPKVRAKISLLSNILDLSAYQNVKLGLEITNWKKWNFESSLGYSQNKASYAHQILVLNNELIQDINWKNPSQIYASARIANIDYQFSLWLGYRSYSNLLKRNIRGDLFQLSGKYNYLNFGVSKELNFGPIRSEHNVLFQSESNNEFGFPKFTYSGTVKYSFRLFKKNLKSEIGLRANYWPSFDTPEYYPIIGEFSNVITSDDGADALLLFPYFSARVSEFTFFVKGVNLPRVLTSDQINSLPDSNIDGLNLVSGFPIQNYRIRIGVKWTLLD